MWRPCDAFRNFWERWEPRSQDCSYWWWWCRPRRRWRSVAVVRSSLLTFRRRLWKWSDLWCRISDFGFWEKKCWRIISTWHPKRQIWRELSRRRRRLLSPLGTLGRKKKCNEIRNSAVKSYFGISIIEKDRAPHPEDSFSMCRVHAGLSNLHLQPWCRPLSEPVKERAEAPDHTNNYWTTSLYLSRASNNYLGQLCPKNWPGEKIHPEATSQLRLISIIFPTIMNPSQSLIILVDPYSTGCMIGQEISKRGYPLIAWVTNSTFILLMSCSHLCMMLFAHQRGKLLPWRTPNHTSHQSLNYIFTQTLKMHACDQTSPWLTT